MKQYSIHDGERLVRAARDAIETHLTSPAFKAEAIKRHIADFVDEERVFVSIEHYPTKVQRGCVGSYKQAGKLKDALIDAAISATEDPRFVPVSHREFDHMIVGVNLLSKPILIRHTDAGSMSEHVKVGKDGLIIEYGYKSGILMPDSAAEGNWNSEEFLENLCIMAGLAPGSWKMGAAKIFRFSSQIFKEVSPRGPVEEILSR